MSISVTFDELVEILRMHHDSASNPDGFIRELLVSETMDAGFRHRVLVAFDRRGSSYSIPEDKDLQVNSAVLLTDLQDHLVKLEQKQYRVEARAAILKRLQFILDSTMLSDHGWSQEPLYISLEFYPDGLVLHKTAVACLIGLVHTSLSIAPSHSTISKEGFQIMVEPSICDEAYRLTADTLLAVAGKIPAL